MCCEGERGGERLKLRHTEEEDKKQRNSCRGTTGRLSRKSDQSEGEEGKKGKIKNQMETRNVGVKGKILYVVFLSTSKITLLPLR